MLSDRNFDDLCRLIKRCRPWTRARPPWFLFQMWLRRRPMNHEFLVSPIADYLLSAGVSDQVFPQISFPAWVMEHQSRVMAGGRDWNFNPTVRIVADERRKQT